MAYTTWPGSPWIDYEYEAVRPVAEIRNGRDGFVRTVDLVSLERRLYSLPESLTTSERQTVDAFVRARGITRDPFLFEDPKDAARTGVALEGAVNGSNTVFSLPTTGTDEDYRHFPKQGSAVVYRNGTPVGVASVDTDARTITLSSAPASGGTMTADFTGLRLVRARAAPRFRGVTAGFGGYGIELEEIIREAA